MALNTEKLMGIHEIYSPPAAEATIDIVAIHGLNGDATRTWTNKETGICWLSHPDYLPKHLPHARILVFGYNSSISNLTGATPSRDRVHHHAQTLVSELAADRRFSQRQHVPIMFLCHSLGGIVVKRALTYAKEKTSRKVHHLNSIYTCTFGALFFGTPHHGSSKARLLSSLLKLTTSASLSRKLLHTESQLVNALEEESETLQNINDSFSSYMKHLRLYFFWEQHMTDLKTTRDYIVTQDSAAPVFDDTERAGIAADHSGMVKFESPKAQGFRLVVDALQRYGEEAPGLVEKRLREANERLKREWESESIELLRGITPAVAAPSTMLDGRSRVAPLLIDDMDRLREYISSLSAADSRIEARQQPVG